MRGPRAGAAIFLAALLIAGATLVAVKLIAGGSAAQTGTVRVQSASPTPGVDSESGLPTIARSDLPREAQTTLDLIAAGGPFPYDQDGSTYQNRERLLPARPAGTYHEYTVETPGSPDRGARRIVTASTGEAYWTADHYASFARILP